MLFPTVEYALFFLLALTLSWSTVSHHQLHKRLLLILSYVFYGFWDWHFLPLLVAISLYGWTAALGIASGKWRGLWLGMGVFACLGTLGWYKYAAFFFANLSGLMYTIGANVQFKAESSSLPLGISFMTFHSISLMIDVWRGKLKHPPSLEDTLLYVAFFPQLIAGPILRASSFMRQLWQAPNPARIELSRALLLIGGGLFKKVVIANTLATMLVDEVFAHPADFTATQTLLSIYGYAVQIYCDFSGYTDIAIGCALLLGYRFPANFDRPYLSTTPQEFWHRWHISLSTWLREYLFIPLGGSRLGLARTLLNLMITMLLGGLWHGAEWSFVLWGGWHGTLLCMHRLWQKYWIGNGNPAWRSSRIWVILSRVLMFHAVCIGWVFFRASDISQGFELLMRLFDGDWLADMAPGVVLCVLLGLGAQYIPHRLALRVRLAMMRISPISLGILFAMALLLIEVLGPSTPAPFIYFQF